MRRSSEGWRRRTPRASWVLVERWALSPPALSGHSSPVLGGLRARRSTSTKNLFSVLHEHVVEPGVERVHERSAGDDHDHRLRARTGHRREREWLPDARL